MIYSINIDLKSESKREHLYQIFLKEICQINYKPGSVI